MTLHFPTSDKPGLSADAWVIVRSNLDGSDEQALMVATPVISGLLGHDHGGPLKFDSFDDARMHAEHLAEEDPHHDYVAIGSVVEGI